MLDENPSLYHQWWEALHQFDASKAQQLASTHPHLIWSTTTEHFLLPSDNDAIQQLFNRDIGSSLGALNTIQWLILNYQLDNAKTMMTLILNLVDAKDLNDNSCWGGRENTMMHLVSALGYDDLALQFVEKGVHANVPNSHGQLPQHVAQTETMAELLSKIKDTTSPQQLADNYDALPSSTSTELDTTQDQDQFQQSQQQQQLIKPSSSSSSSPSIEQPPTPTLSHSTLRKCGKDDHYFRPGQVEETKQKVLGDEQVELEKQRERRRKDIALLAQRSAVKNNPFVKKSEPSATSDSDHHLSPSSTHNDSLTSNAAILRIQANDFPHSGRKCKRNSKGINSLQTKSYVSSSIFRQGQPPHNAKQSSLAHHHHQQQHDRQRLEKASIEKFDNMAQDTALSDGENSNEQTMDLLSDGDDNDDNDDDSSVVAMDPLDFSTTHSTTLDNDNGDGDNDSDNDSNSNQSMVSALSSTDHAFQDSDSSLTVSENNDHPPAENDTTKLATSLSPSSSTTPSEPSPALPPKTASNANISSTTPARVMSNTNASSTLSVNSASTKNISLVNTTPSTNTSSTPPAKTVSNTNTAAKSMVNTSTKKEQSSKIQLEEKKPSAKLTRDNMLIRDYATDTKRQSGSQKSHWSKELTSWVTILNREFSLNVDDDELKDQAETTTSINDLTLALEKASKFGDDPIECGPTMTTTPDTDKKRNGTSRHDDDAKQLSNASTSTNEHYTKYETDLHLMGNRLLADHNDEETRRRGMDDVLGKYSEHGPKLYGSVSGRRPAAIYAKKAPLFDLMNMGKDTGNCDNTSVRNKSNPLATLELSSSTSSPPPPSITTSADHHHHRHQNHHHHHHHSHNNHQHQHQNYHQQKQLPQQKKNQSATTTATNLSSKLFDRGKLYVRVNSVNDILLPLPRDRAHVRCVIGDGKYEYMSRYELLGQNIPFGFECIIDSHPDMIITLSLHVRPDYMLKKPLKRLFSSNRKRKGSLSAYVSNEDGAVGQTRFAVGDMLGACYKKPYAGCFYCFNAWHIHTAKDKPSATAAATGTTATTSSSSSSISITSSSSSLSSTNTTSSSVTQQQELDQGVLKVVGNFKVQLLYLPVLNPSSPVPRNLHECDMAIKAQL